MSISNSCRFIGNLVRDPEFKFVAQAGIGICNFCIAVSDDYDYKNDDKTQFPEFVAFNKTAEFIANNVEKGCKVVVEAKMSTDKWKTEDGQKRSKVKFVVENFKPLTWKDKGNNQRPQSNPGYDQGSGYTQQTQSQQQQNDDFSGFEAIDNMEDVPF